MKQTNRVTVILLKDLGNKKVGAEQEMNIQLAAELIKQKTVKMKGDGAIEFKKLRGR